MSTPQHYLLLSVALFAIGIAVVATRKHRLVKLLGLELLLQAVNLALGALTSSFQDWDGRVAALALVSITAVELVIGLVVIATHRQDPTSVEPVA
jgi:NADH-quinone oxidoreductase subunit K